MSKPDHLHLPGVTRHPHRGGYPGGQKGGGRGIDRPGGAPAGALQPLVVFPAQIGAGDFASASSASVLPLDFNELARTVWPPLSSASSTLSSSIVRKSGATKPSGMTLT